jgi:hypothetical protein
MQIFSHKSAKEVIIFLFSTCFGFPGCPPSQLRTMPVKTAVSGLKREKSWQKVSQLHFFYLPLQRFITKDKS